MGLEMDRVQRLVVGVLLPAAFLGLWIVPVLLFAGDLPDPIAIHFGTSGAADGSAPLWVHVLTMGVFVVVSSLILVWAAWRPSSSLGVEAALATFIGALFSIVSAQVILSNRDLDSWRDATIGGSGVVWGAVVGSLAAGLAVAGMVRHAARLDTGETTPAVPVAPGERVAWIGRSSSWQFGAGAVFLVFLGTVLTLTLSASRAAGIAVLFAGLAMVCFMSVTVTVSDAGVRVRAGALRWPGVTLPLAEIEAARHVEDFNPMRDGARLSSAEGARGTRFLNLGGVGWGYRGSLRLFGAAAWVLGRGPALELDLVDGKRFIVTVDGAEQAAALVNGLLARQSVL